MKRNSARSQPGPDPVPAAGRQRVLARSIPTGERKNVIMPMDFPETRMLERGLKEFRLDAVTALAVLLKTLGDDHLARAAHLEPVDDLADDFDPDDEANARTTLERVLHVLKRECD